MIENGRTRLKDFVGGSHCCDDDPETTPLARGPVHAHRDRFRRCDSPRRFGVRRSGVPIVARRPTLSCRHRGSKSFENWLFHPSGRLSLAGKHDCGFERLGLGRYVVMGHESRERGTFVSNHGSAATNGLGWANACRSALRALQLHGKGLPG